MDELKRYFPFWIFWALCCGQAAWARSHPGLAARVLHALNGWAGVIAGAGLIGALAAIVAMLLSSGHLVTGVAGLGWSGDDELSGWAFAIGGLVGLAALGVLYVRTPRSSLLAGAFVYLVPALLGIVFLFQVIEVLAHLRGGPRA